MTPDIVTLKSLSVNSAQMQATIDHLTEFRQQLYDGFDHRADAMMFLLDAICSNTTASAVVQLSLNPVFDYSYNSVYDAIKNFFVPSDTAIANVERENQERRRIRLISNYLPDDKDDSFVLFSVDVTPAPRRFAHTLVVMSMPQTPLRQTSLSPSDTNIPP